MPGDGKLIARRSLLRAGGLAGLSLALGRRSALAAVAGEERRLRMFHTHTLERIDVTYFAGGEVVPGALGEIDHFLRDHYTGEMHPIDPGVLDVAWSLARAAGRPAGELEIVCGYRSPRTNEMLRHRTEGVARHSLHLEGRAIDLRLRGVPTERLRDLAIALGRGGVGYYHAHDFVHVDTGRPRRW